MDRCALFVDAGYVLADGAMAVHGTRHRDSVSWDYAGLLKFLSGLSRDRSGLPVLRCYWYEATVEGRRTTEHDTLADLPGLKLRLGRMRPGRREGVETEMHRDLTTLGRNGAISDAILVSGDEDLAEVVAEVQDLGIRVILVHVTVDGNWTTSRLLRQECDDILEIGSAHLRPFVDLVAGAEPARRDEEYPAGAYQGRSLANGHGSVLGAVTRHGLPAAALPAAPPIYTAPVVADYQRGVQPQPAAGPAEQEEQVPARSEQGDLPGRPGEAQPAGAQPAGAQPAGAQPAGAQPGGSQPGGSQPGGAQAGAQPAGSQQGQALPGKAGGTQDQPASTPGQAGSVQQSQPGLHAQPGAETQGEPGLHGPPGAEAQGEPGLHGQTGSGPQSQPRGTSRPGAHGARAYPPDPFLDRLPAPAADGAPRQQPGPGRTQRHGLGGARHYPPPEPYPPVAQYPVPGQYPAPEQYPPAGSGQYGAAEQPPPHGQHAGPPSPSSGVPQGGPYSGPQPAATQAPVPPPVAVSLADAVQAAHAEGVGFGEAVARDAPALWLEAVLARKPRMPSDLEARLLQGSGLPIDSLLHDEVRHALRRGFWDALERSRR